MTQTEETGGQDFGEAVRPVFFQTEHEEFLYATHGGSLFVVRFRGRTYGLTCKHVFHDFEPSKLFIPGEKFAQKGSKPAPIVGVCYPSSPRDGATETDIGDVFVIEFADDLPTDFFKGSEYVIDEKSAVTAQVGHELEVAGVLKEKTRIDPPDMQMGYCRLQFRDAGPSSDPFLRRAVAQFWKPEFSSITGISGSPVFDRTTNALCGMVVRGGMTGTKCEIHYVDIADIVRLLDAIDRRLPQTYYTKNVIRPVAVSR